MRTTKCQNTINLQIKSQTRPTQAIKLKSFIDPEARKTNTIGEDYEWEVVDFQRQSKIETNPSEESNPNSKNEVEASSVVLEEEESSVFDTWILIGWTD